MSNIISFFQKLIKGGGVGIRVGGLENFSKIYKQGGRLFGTQEYSYKGVLKGLQRSLFKESMFYLLKSI